MGYTAPSQPKRKKGRGGGNKTSMPGFMSASGERSCGGGAEARLIIFFYVCVVTLKVCLLLSQPRMASHQVVGAHVVLLIDQLVDFVWQ